MSDKQQGSPAEASHGPKRENWANEEGRAEGFCALARVKWTVFTINLCEYVVCIIKDDLEATHPDWGSQSNCDPTWASIFFISPKCVTKTNIVSFYRGKLFDFREYSILITTFNVVYLPDYLSSLLIFIFCDVKFWRVVLHVHEHVAQNYEEEEKLKSLNKPPRLISFQGISISIIWHPADTH